METPRAIKLTKDEAKTLRTQVVGSGGFQYLLRQLQEKLSTGNILYLTKDDEFRIYRYVLDYGDGGFQKRIPVAKIFDKEKVAEMGRIVALRELVTAHQVPVAWLNRWIANRTTIEEASAQVLDMITQRAKAQAATLPAVKLEEAKTTLRDAGYLVMRKEDYRPPEAPARTVLGNKGGTKLKEVASSKSFVVMASKDAVFITLR